MLQEHRFPTQTLSRPCYRELPKVPLVGGHHGPRPGSGSLSLSLTIFPVPQPGFLPRRRGRFLPGEKPRERQARVPRPGPGPARPCPLPRAPPPRRGLGAAAAAPGVTSAWQRNAVARANTPPRRPGSGCWRGGRAAAIGRCFSEGRDQRVRASGSGPSPLSAAEGGGAAGRGESSGGAQPSPPRPVRGAQCRRSQVRARGAAGPPSLWGLGGGGLLAPRRGPVRPLSRGRASRGGGGGSVRLSTSVHPGVAGERPRFYCRERFQAGGGAGGHADCPRRRARPAGASLKWSGRPLRESGCLPS